MPRDGEPLPGTTNVLRLPRPPPEFQPDSWRPTDKQFEPSNADKEYANTSGKPVRVSVWDEELTTVEQASAFRAGETLCLRLRVQVVLDTASEHGGDAVRVVYDPLPAVESEKPGAEGHAGIEGLERGSKPRKAWRVLLQAIADKADLLR
jgi:hypothetical protein